MKPKKSARQELSFFGMPHAWLGKRGLAPDVKPWIATTIPIIPIGLNSMVTVYHAALKYASEKAAVRKEAELLFEASKKLVTIAHEMNLREPSEFLEATIRDITMLYGVPDTPANDSVLMPYLDIEIFKPEIQHSIRSADRLYDEYGAKHLILAIGISADGVRGLATEEDFEDVVAYMKHVLFMLDRVWQKL